VNIFGLQVYTGSQVTTDINTQTAVCTTAVVLQTSYITLVNYGGKEFLKQAIQVRMLVITARERLAGYTDIPIMKELGIAIDMGPWLGFLAPAGTPADIVAKLNAAFDAAMAEPSVKETMGKMSMVADRMSPQAYQSFYNNEYDRWGIYIRTANVKLD
jgi:tripartite-type tricarboxylate transporter receptor subunit TctC